MATGSKGHFIITRKSGIYQVGNASLSLGRGGHVRVPEHDLYKRQSDAHFQTGSAESLGRHPTTAQQQSSACTRPGLGLDHASSQLKVSSEDRNVSVTTP